MFRRMQDQRWERRRRRLWFEELVAWIVVPMVFILGWIVYDQVISGQLMLRQGASQETTAR
jgi:hypothetical protein